MELEFIRPILQEYLVQDLFLIIRSYVREINYHRGNPGLRLFKNEFKSNNIPIELVFLNYIGISPYEMDMISNNFMNFFINNHNMMTTIDMKRVYYPRKQFISVNKQYDISLFLNNVYIINPIEGHTYVIMVWPEILGAF
jgi:hypothetical protein